MKTPKSSDSEEVTPSKKVLKQARLPFKTISDVSPKTPPPPSRKRKLSAPEPEPITKVGKITKKSGEEEILVISDEDSNNTPEGKKVPLNCNPFVKLVDTAWKKKLQKTKGAKKRKGGPKMSKTVTNGSVQNNENECDGSEVECVEEMDVDEEKGQEPEVLEKEINQTNDLPLHYTDTEENKTPEPTKVSEDNIIELDDNSNSTDKSIKNKSESSLDESNSPKDSKSDVEKSPAESKEPNTKTEQEKDRQDSKQVDLSLNKSPKRSERIKSKVEDKNLDTSVVSNCDESLSSDPSTPRRSNRKVSLTNSQGDVSMSESTTTNPNITPKQVSSLIFYSRCSSIIRVKYW